MIDGRSLPELESPVDYLTIEEGARQLSFRLTFSENNKGGIREAGILEPMNQESIDRFLDALRLKLREQVETGDVRFSATNVWMNDESLSRIINKYKDGGCDFLTKYLSDHHPDLRNGVLILRADTSNFTSAGDVFIFANTIVENDPALTLQTYCRESNVKLLFLFDERDFSRYFIQLGASGMIVRPMITTQTMIDLEQVENPQQFLELRRIPESLRKQWLEEVRF